MKTILITVFAVFYTAVFSQEILPLEVDYNLTINEMVKKGNYFYSDEKIISSPFSSSKEGKEKMNIKLFSFEGLITSEKVISEMKEAGFRPAVWEEGLAFGIQYPLIQLKKPIVILGTVFDNKVVFLYKTYMNKEDYDNQKKPKRAVGITSWWNQYTSEYYFLGIKN